MSKIVTRHENIESFISSIKSLEKKYNIDYSTTPSTTTGAIFEPWGDIYNSRNDSDESREFMGVVEELMGLINIHHIGSGILYTDAYYADGQEEFENEATPIVIDYIRNNLWDDICNSDWDDEVQ